MAEARSAGLIGVTLSVMATRQYTHREVAVQIIRVLRDAGHVAYLAGGCVRDDWLGVVPKDYDVATDATPDQVRRYFPHSRLVGEAFGVVLVRQHGYTTEVATFRLEWGYTDGRRPARVEFCDAEHDARRRDFTINGMFEDPLADDPVRRFIDFVGAKNDLDAGLIRAIGDPDERFAEDHLRLLRAVRFSSRLGFEIEPGTLNAIEVHADKLSEISRERIGQEVKSMLTVSPQASVKAVTLLQYLGLDAATLNESHAQPGLATVASLGAASYPTVLGAWVLDRHLFADQPDLVGQVSGRQPWIAALLMCDAVEHFMSERFDGVVVRWRGALCLTNDQCHALRRTIELLVPGLIWRNLGIAKRKRLMAKKQWPQVSRLVAALGGLTEMTQVAEMIEADRPQLAAEGFSPRPWVDGHDLIELGFSPGPIFKRLLNRVYDAQLKGLVNDRDEALDWVTRHHRGSQRS